MSLTNILEPTKLLYLETNTGIKNNLFITHISQRREDELFIVNLDQTIFYPQSGGQPFDTGYIKFGQESFRVKEVRMNEMNIVDHIGTFEHEPFYFGDSVIVYLNERRRLLHSRLHSAGHVIEMALSLLNFHWKPYKSLHFLENSFMEYLKNDDIKNVEDFRLLLEKTCNELIAKNYTVKVMMIEKKDLPQYCRFIDEKLQFNEKNKCRVIVFNDFGMPCSGTHVTHLKDIIGMTITKIKDSGNSIKISYQIN